jgi:hypothetical protein
MIRHAFYSATAAWRHGCAVHLTTDGRKVTITGLFDSREAGEAGYAYDDKRYVGIVTMPAIFDGGSGEWGRFEDEFDEAIRLCSV